MASRPTSSMRSIAISPGRSWASWRASAPHLTGDALAAVVGIPQVTLTNKAKAVRYLPRLRPLDLEFARREHLADPLTASFFRYSTIP